MKVSWQYNCPTSPCLLVFKANWKQPNLRAESFSGLWALLRAVNHLPREMEESDSINLLLARTHCSSHLKLLQGFRHTGPLQGKFFFHSRLRNQSMGRSVDSWQQSSSFLQNVTPPSQHCLFWQVSQEDIKLNI